MKKNHLLIKEIRIPCVWNMKILSINYIDKQLVCDASISTKIILLIPISNYTTITNMTS